MVFLIINGIELNASEGSFEKIILSAAEGKIEKAAVARFFKNNAGT